MSFPKWPEDRALSVGFLSPEVSSPVTDRSQLGVFLSSGVCKVCCHSPGLLCKAAHRVWIKHLLLLAFNPTCLYKSIKCLPTSSGTFWQGQLRCDKEQQPTDRILLKKKKNTPLPANPEIFEVPFAIEKLLETCLELLKTS